MRTSPTSTKFKKIRLDERSRIHNQERFSISVLQGYPMLLFLVFEYRLVQVEFGWHGDGGKVVYP